MAKPAKTDPISLKGIEGLRRVETSPMRELMPAVQAATPESYSPDQVHGRFCTVADFVAAPPQEVWEYLADARSLAEWGYTIRNFRTTDTPDVWIADDFIARDTDIYIRTEANAGARTVDYHCAWDQGEELWMIYLMRVLDAQTVLGRPGSVVTWTNCKHPNYDVNPFAEIAPAGRPWVGDFWNLFFPGHAMELTNLKLICEYRHAAGESITPDWNTVNP